MPGRETASSEQYVKRCAVIHVTRNRYKATSSAASAQRAHGTVPHDDRRFVAEKQLSQTMLDRPGPARNRQEVGN